MTPCKHDPLAQRTSLICAECQRERNAFIYAYQATVKDPYNSILDLQQRTAELEKQVAALKQFNEAARGEALPPAKTPVDRTLEADLQAARGVKPAYKSDVQRIMELKGFIMDILSPEMYGHAVTREVRNAARRVLGIDTQE